MRTITRRELLKLAEEVGLPAKERDRIAGWLNRGDGVAVYQNREFGHPELGHRQFCTYGSPKAMFETDAPPQTLPDTTTINWRYQLEAMCRDR